MIKLLLNIINWISPSRLQQWFVNQIVYNNQDTVNVAAFARRYSALCTLIDQEYIDATINRQRKQIGFSYALARVLFEDELSSKQIAQLHQFIEINYCDLHFDHISTNDLIVKVSSRSLNLGLVHLEEEYIKSILQLHRSNHILIPLTE